MSNNDTLPLIGYLRELRQRNDRAALAALRRGLSTPDSAEVLRYVLPFVHTNYVQEEAVYILVAALFATHSDESTRGMGAALREVTRITDSKSVEQRFVALLDADREQVATHLRYAVQLCKSKSVGIDYNRLLKDMLQWNNPARHTQLRWAREFWIARNEDNVDSAITAPSEKE